jgi:hypothetical protein
MENGSKGLLATLALALAAASCGGGAPGQSDGGETCMALERVPCSTSPTGLCDLNGKPAPARTAAENAYVQAHCIQPR